MRRTLLCLLVAACSGGGSPSAPPAVNDLDVTMPAAADAQVAVAVTPPPDATPAAAVADAAAPPADAAPVAASAGAAFTDEARLLYRMAACGTLDVPLAPEVQKVVDRHCKQITPRLEQFRAAYLVKHRAWFDKVVPKDAPPTVVYPFGGGDLLSALVAFPEATEITTISLELAGDPRRIKTLTPKQLDASLGALRVQIGGLIAVGSNTSENLSAGQQNELPTQVSSFLLGLVAAGFEPVAMRYFTIAPSGELAYLDDAEIAALDAKRMKSLKRDWNDPNFSEAFSNVEIQYRRPGETATRVHRHIGWNLGDTYMTANPQLLAHLSAKGKVTLLTKGASYLLWRGDFSKIRNYMLGHLAWMLSDSTGIPPAYAKKARMVQTTYGQYTGAFLEGAQTSPHDADFIELWAKSPQRRLGFRFGYVDKDRHAHVVVTRPR